MDGSDGPAMHGSPNPILRSHTRASPEPELEYFSRTEVKQSTIFSIDPSKTNLRGFTIVVFEPIANTQLESKRSSIGNEVFGWTATFLRSSLNNNVGRPRVRRTFDTYLLLLDPALAGQVRKL